MRLTLLVSLFSMIAPQVIAKPLPAHRIPAGYCGAVCVQRVLSSHSTLRPELSELIHQLNGSDRAADVAFPALAQALRSRGVQAAFFRCRASALRLWPNHVIVHCDGHHFAVIEGVDDVGHAVVAWAPSDVRHMNWSDLESRCSPCVLLVAPASATSLANQVGMFRWQCIANACRYILVLAACGAPSIYLSVMIWRGIGLIGGTASRA